MSEKRKRRAVLLALSDAAFGNAQALLKHIIDSDMTEGDPAYPGVIAGVVVNYARPFTNNHGLGSLEEEFRRLPIFQQTDLQPVYDYVMNMRHQLFAHFDMTSFTALVAGTKGIRPPDEVIVEFEADTPGFRISTNEIRPPAANLPLIDQLLLIQRLRVSKTLNDHMASWIKQRPLPGKYHLTPAGLVPIPVAL